ncbi:putative serine esterase-domain-containing protein [Kalaharituber pfeilii]|nr:putative serine esterase-domain-containing protein [Kalaharituber pfeilii]
MLLVHTTGSVKVGEAVRYTVTYTPSLDDTFPLPEHLYLRIRNTASLPLRAAYLHGPYILYVSVRRQEFHPYLSWSSKIEGDELEIPQFEPNLKAGASFYTALMVPEALRKDVFEMKKDIPEQENAPNSFEQHSEIFQGRSDGLSTNTSPQRPKSVTWIIEVISQTIFSEKATVGFEVLLGKDQQSLGYGLNFSAPIFPGLRTPVLDKSGTPNDTTGTGGGGGESKPTGVLSDCIKMKVQDTADLWNLPPFPSWSDKQLESSYPSETECNEERELPDPDELDERERKRKKEEAARRKKRITKKVHLVIITHGLHSNTGADMLFMKEAIDEEAGRAEEAYQEKKRTERGSRRNGNEALDESSENKIDEQEMVDEDREMTIVRGFSGNVCRTERGIKYLGKRLAKYVLSLANPQQLNPPPLQKPAARTPNKLRKSNYHHRHLTPAAKSQAHTLANSQKQQQENLPQQPPYKITSISFIGHSLGGLVQTYAIAFIHAHHPNFFKEAKPINFVALATPFLGLSNENPAYVRFALDFGLVGRTGQDLGLTWRAPNMAASAFNVLANHAPFGNSARDNSTNNGDKSNSVKPLLRILPTGPAHEAFKLFRNRTVYANVVNDGIVPLRTSCLLYLDWKGLEKVEKARRENQVLGLVEWGLGQLTTRGSSFTPSLNTQSSKKMGIPSILNEDKDVATPVEENDSANAAAIAKTEISTPGTPNRTKISLPPMPESGIPNPQPVHDTPNPFSSLVTLFKPQAGKKPQQEKVPKIYHRSQISPSQSPTLSPPLSPAPSELLSRAASPPIYAATSPILDAVPQENPSLATSDNYLNNPSSGHPPPKTGILEAAHYTLNPPLPTVEFIINPSSRPKTIWHDRVYHSEDIPAPQTRPRARTLLGVRLGNGNNKDDGSSIAGIPKQGTTSSESSNGFLTRSSQEQETVQLKVEEKIARAYHKDLSWRKVLVRLEPDAHNNIVVRRMFANAYGWPVVHHLVDTHFGDTPEAMTADAEEGRGERPNINVNQNKMGMGVLEADPKPSILLQTSAPHFTKNVTTETCTTPRTRKKRSPTNSTDESVWTDTAFNTTDDEVTEGETEGQSKTDDRLSKAPNGSKSNWNPSLGFKWPLTAWSNVNTAEESTSTTEQGENLHAALPIANITKVDAWAHGGITDDNGFRAGKEPKSSITETGRGSVILEDAVRIGLGTGGSSAIKELVKVKGSVEKERRGSASTLTAGTKDEGRENEGVVEKVARFSFRN